MPTDPTRRFSSRVDDYVKYRPGYPPGALDILRTDCGLTADSIIADVGSGTGIFSRLLLDNGNPVFGVEPNAEMRTAAEHSLSRCEKFTSVNGTSEATTLPAASVDLVTAAQAFHWFDRTRTRAEFARVLQPGGWMALVWNDRRLDSTPFLREFEQLLLTYGTDYQHVRHRDLDLGQVQNFVGDAPVKFSVLEQRQVFDFDGVRGRLLSSSYAPEAGHPNHQPMLERLREMFDAHQREDSVSFDYDTHIYCAQLTPTAE